AWKRRPRYRPADGGGISRTTPGNRRRDEPRARGRGWQRGARGRRRPGGADATEQARAVVAGGVAARGRVAAAGTVADAKIAFAAGAERGGGGGSVRAGGGARGGAVAVAAGRAGGGESVHGGVLGVGGSVSVNRCVGKVQHLFASAMGQKSPHRRHPFEKNQPPYRIGASPAPNAVNSRVGRPFSARLTSGKSPTGRWHSRNRGWSGGSGPGHVGPGTNS